MTHNLREVDYIPLTDIMIRADIPDTEIRKTQYSKTMMNDLKLLTAKYGIDITKRLKVENFAENDYVIYRQRLNEKV